MEKLTITKLFTLICKELKITKIKMSTDLGFYPAKISLYGHGAGHHSISFTEAKLISDYIDDKGIWIEPKFFIEVYNGLILEKDFKL